MSTAIKKYPYSVSTFLAGGDRILTQLRLCFRVLCGCLRSQCGSDDRDENRKKVVDESRVADYHISSIVQTAGVLQFHWWSLDSHMATILQARTGAGIIHDCAGARLDDSVWRGTPSVLGRRRCNHPPCLTLSPRAADPGATGALAPCRGPRRYYWTGLLVSGVLGADGDAEDYGWARSHGGSPPPQPPDAHRPCHCRCVRGQNPSNTMGPQCQMVTGVGDDSSPSRASLRRRGVAEGRCRRPAPPLWSGAARGVEGGAQGVTWYIGGRARRVAAAILSGASRFPPPLVSVARGQWQPGRPSTDTRVAVGQDGRPALSTRSPPALAHCMVAAWAVP